MAIELTAEERELLRTGLVQWGGPAGPTDELAAAMGFGDVPSFSPTRLGCPSSSTPVRLFPRAT